MQADFQRRGFPMIMLSKRMCSDLKSRCGLTILCESKVPIACSPGPSSGEPFLQISVYHLNLRLLSASLVTTHPGLIMYNRPRC